MCVLLVVGTLVAFLESEVFSQSYPSFCSKSIELIWTGVHSIDETSLGLYVQYSTSATVRKMA
jgi:hypothetical protein